MKHTLLGIIIGYTTLYFSFSETLGLLVHPMYHPIITLSGVFLSLLSTLSLFSSAKTPLAYSDITLFCGYIMCILLLFSQPIMPLSSATASLRGSKEGNFAPPLSAFIIKPENRTLSDWIRLERSVPIETLHNLNAHIQGFILKDTNGETKIGQYVMSCCIADAQVIGLPFVSQESYPEGTWIQTSGTMKVEKNRLLFFAEKTEYISPPKNAYTYRQ